MAETLRGGLSLATCGFAFWSHDISGFEQTASPDIYKRWCQFGLLSSHSRLHGSSSYRVPWLFDEEACDVLREMVGLKCRLMPYLYRLAVEAHEKGLPLMRPMFLEYPQDRTTLPLDLQYMLGESLLVAPIFSETGEAEYYLPAGTWYNLTNGETLTGPGWQKGTFNYHEMPLFVAANTILPLGCNSTRPDYDYTEGLELLLTEFEDGAQTQTFVPDQNGAYVMEITAVRSGQQITVTVQGAKSWTVRLPWAEDAVISQEGDQAVITLQ
jgi:alpha-D-xyloside xylohydrolase